MRYLKIPLERVGVLIGAEGGIKKELEKRSGAYLEIDSKQGEVSIDEKNISDPLMILKLENIIKAIARGFSAENAMRLFSDDADFFIFDIYEYVGKKDTHMRRLKSRVIGRAGKTRRVLEELTDSNISIYGHTISVISDISSINVVKTAIDMLLKGSRHSTVYRYVESNMKKLRLGDIF